MAEYRAHFLTEVGHITKALDLDYPSDEAAKEAAKQLVDGHDVELWQFGRKIETFRYESD
jgi:hypothetical protein